MDVTTIILGCLAAALGALITWARFAKSDQAQIHTSISEAAGHTVEAMQLLIDELKCKIEDMEVELCHLKEQNERLLAENIELRSTIDNLIRRLDK
jgi:FtsZ-binding cell division protein ZapB